MLIVSVKFRQLVMARAVSALRVGCAVEIFRLNQSSAISVEAKVLEGKFVFVVTDVTNLDSTTDRKPGETEILLLSGFVEKADTLVGTLGTDVNAHCLPVVGSKHLVGDSISFCRGTEKNLIHDHVDIRDIVGRAIFETEGRILVGNFLGDSVHAEERHIGRAVVFLACKSPYVC